MEASPASAALSQAAGLALAALDRMSQGPRWSDEQEKQQIAALAAAEEQGHKSQITLPARPAFQRLIEAASAGGACTR
jgi:DNA invertase Pin-like site-specific DNA recombinase